MNPALIDAKIAGRDAGRLDLAISLDPYPKDSLESLTWRTERILVICERALARAQEQERAHT